MNSKQMFAFALAGAMVITGCVSIETLENDLKSNDSKKQTVASQNLVEIVTKGKVGFSKFSSKDRLWCAKHITDKGDIIKVIKKMSYSDLSECNNLTPQDEVVACKGFEHDDNAPILEAVLGNLGVNKNAIDILTQNGIHYKPKVYDVAVKYAKLYIESLTDMDELNGLRIKYNKDWRCKNALREYLAKGLDIKDVIPSRMITITSSPDDIKKIVKGYEEVGSEIPKEIFKAAVSKVKDQKELIALYWSVDTWLRGLIFEYIIDLASLSEIAEKEDDYRLATEAVGKINDRETLIRIALFANHISARNDARSKVHDKKAIIGELVKAINEKKISNKDVAWHIMASVDTATLALYNAVQDESLKRAVFDKLSGEDRKLLREGNTAKCKQMIEAAKAKSSETFEMGGFYLGMDISDVEPLVGYYFPEWTTSEKVDDDENDIRVVYVPQQRRPFCRADKTGKVWQFNFGKNFLKKFFKYDVQDEREWARAYSKEHGIDMKHVFLNKDTTVADVSGSLNVTTYKAWLNQNTWQWKDNAKGYRLVYFAEPKIETAHGNIVKQQALYQFRFISSDAGTLRATIERD